VAEITDPEALLSLVTSKPAASPRPASSRPATSARTANGKAAKPATAYLQEPLPFGAPEGVSETAAPAPAPESSPDLDSAAPDSTVRPMIRLSDNETVARVSNAGIVIRRRKK
jgi:hypothetical protein